ncbi:YkoF family thiamine/hydroxymethylpyrimidine-binding protein [Thermosediminibacter oceani]|uniref:YKOF domain protein n=1 Tax=Thermosediminibacter oceani (strain ATCC BAA-1034 / DSM 16646 / JW/IW-1228P) TaxID=555079 RepID=D9RZT4_THEOJ|nr:YkoF family thiamine/hydroxymethylpyrimidine-binding protein [Thermosediminibacter oceani]ADL08711.1 YKOF domain protein [Thermosediminibacter oceani DSM 16646]
MFTCQVSLFPLGREDYERVVLKSLQSLEEFDVDVDVTPLSTLIRGSEEEVWKAVRALYDAGAREGGKVVMFLTMTNRTGKGS